MTLDSQMASFLELNNPSRRRFLKKTAVGFLTLSLARVTFSNGISSKDPSSPKVSLRILSPKQFQVLETICDRMIPPSEGMPGTVDLNVAGRIDEFLSTVDRPIAEQMAQLLDVFEVSPIIFDLQTSRFTSLRPHQQDEVLKSWATSRLEFRRTGFVALKRLALSAYYGNEATWKAIGYDGPLV